MYVFILLYFIVFNLFYFIVLYVFYCILFNLILFRFDQKCLAQPTCSLLRQRWQNVFDLDRHLTPGPRKGSCTSTCAPTCTPTDWLWCFAQKTLTIRRVAFWQHTHQMSSVCSLSFPVLHLSSCQWGSPTCAHTHALSHTHTDIPPLQQTHIWVQMVSLYLIKLLFPVETGHLDWGFQNKSP